MRRVIRCLHNWAPAIAMAVSFLLLALAGVYSFRQQNHVDAALCQSNVNNRMALRGSWISLQALSLANTAANPALNEEEKEAQRERVRIFITAVLQPIPALECVDNQPVPKGEQ